MTEEKRYEYGDSVDPGKDVDEALRRLALAKTPEEFNRIDQEFQAYIDKRIKRSTRVMWIFGGLFVVLFCSAAGLSIHALGLRKGLIEAGCFLVAFALYILFTDLVEKLFSGVMRKHL